MNNIIQFLIGFLLPDIGYWNFPPWHFTSLLYLGEIYRTLSEVTLKKSVECGSAIQSVLSVTLETISSHLTTKWKATQQSNFCGPSHHISDTFCRFLNVARCVTGIQWQHFQTFFGSPFSITFEPHSMAHKLLQYHTVCLHTSYYRTIQCVSTQATTGPYSVSPQKLLQDHTVCLHTSYYRTIQCVSTEAKNQQIHK